MKLLKKLLITTPLLTTAVTAVSLSSCSIDDKNSVHFEGDSKILTTNHSSFTLTLYLQYILEGNTKIVLKINNTQPESGFTFQESYIKYNLIGRKLEFNIDFSGATVGSSTTFDVEVYGIKQNKTVWSSKIQGFTLVYTTE